MHMQKPLVLRVMHIPKLWLGQPMRQPMQQLLLRLQPMIMQTQNIHQAVAQFLVMWSLQVM